LPDADVSAVWQAERLPDNSCDDPRLRIVSAVVNFFREIFYYRIDNIRLNFTLGIPRNASD
jgi:hypothetical protein